MLIFRNYASPSCKVWLSKLHEHGGILTRGVLAPNKLSYWLGPFPALSVSSSKNIMQDLIYLNGKIEESSLFALPSLLALSVVRINEKGNCITQFHGQMSTCIILQSAMLKTKPFLPHCPSIS